MLLTELLTPDRVLVSLSARDKGGALAELTRLLVERSGGTYDEVMAAVAERESVLSTGIGDGVAIPHARAPSVRELSLVGGVSRTPVPYDSVDGQPVQLFFLIVGPETSAGPHVMVLSRIARLVRHESVRRRLVDARTPEEFCDALAAAEVS